jgi:Trypsin
MKTLLILLSLVFFTISAHAQEVSIIGDGSKYYCYLEPEDYDGYSYVYLIKADTDREASFSSTLRSLKKRITRVKQLIKRYSRAGYDTTSLKSELNYLNTTRNDILSCRNNGSTGKYDGDSNDPIENNPTPPANNPSPVNACSVAGDNSAISARIVGGSQCSIGNSPVVYISLRDNRGNSAGACTGTVVRRADQSESNTVIFAAHCAEGVSSLTIATPNGNMSTNNIYSYPRWNSSGIIENGDVAVAKFSQTIPTRSVLLLDSNNFQLGETGVIAGYGQDQNGDAYANRLKAGDVTIGDITSGGISIFYQGNGANTCFGDSGGPLFVERNGQWVLAGVTSNGESSNCGVGDRSNFANITESSVKSWIQGLM